MKARKPLQIRQRLWIFLSALLLAFVAGGVAGPVRINIIQGQTDWILDRKLPAMQAEYDLENNLLEQSSLTMDFFRSPAKPTLSRIRGLREEYRAALKRFRQFEEPALVEEVTTTMEGMMADSMARQDRIFSRFESTGKVIDAEEGFTQESLDRELIKITGLQRKVSAYLRARARSATLAHLNEAGNYVRQAGRSAMLVTFGVLATTLVAGFFMAWRLGRAIGLPLARLVATMGSVQDGSRTVDLQGLRDDEFGTIGTSLSSMVATMAGSEADLSRLNVAQARILDSVRFGLLVLDGSGKIGDVQSRFAHDAFSSGDLGGTDFGELVFPGPSGQANRDLLVRFLAQVRANRIVSRSMLDDINPLRDYRLEARDASGRARDLQFHFHPLLDGHDGVLVSFEDVTDLRAARRDSERERQRHAGELEVLLLALRIGPEVVRTDLARAGSSCQDVVDSLVGTPDRAAIDQAFRVLHTIKGNAASLGFTVLSERAHSAEDILQPLRDTGGRQVPSSLMTILEELAADIRQARDMVDRLMSISGASGGTQGPDPLERFRLRLQDMVERTGRDLDKTVVLETRLHPDMLAYQGLDDAILHLLRNSLDHGVEETYERLACGKENPARIHIACEAGKDGLKLSVGDDGRGLDPAAIEAAARRRGLIAGKDGPLSAEAAARIIFTPGFSRKEEADSLSGRGVGLDAVKTTVSRLGGRINLSSKPGKGTRFVLLLPGLPRG